MSTSFNCAFWCLLLLAILCLCPLNEAKKDSKTVRGRGGHRQIKKEKEQKFISYGLPVGLTKNLTTQNYLAYLMLKNCKDEKPWCLGQDCSIVPDARGCLICACPIGSKARGCDKMPQDLYNDLWVNGCPKVVNGKMTRSPPQKVTRYYRHIDKEKNIDECRYYSDPFYPLCPEIDENLWNGPQTEDECKKVCFWRYPSDTS